LHNIHKNSLFYPVLQKPVKLSFTYLAYVQCFFSLFNFSNHAERIDYFWFIDKIHFEVSVL